MKFNKPFKKGYICIIEQNLKLVLYVEKCKIFYFFKVFYIHQIVVAIGSKLVHFSYFKNIHII